MALFLMQAPQSQADHTRAAMAESLAKQRVSVRSQMGGLAAPKSSAPLHVSHPECASVVPPELARMIDDAARDQHVNPILVREVAREESGFRSCAVSPRGAEGLMQLMPVTQTQFQVRNPFSPQQSLQAGSKLLKQLLDRYQGDLSLALSAYNAGPARVDKAGGVPAIPETEHYVSDILSRLLP